MSFDSASDATREAVAREAARSHPGRGCVSGLTPEMVAFFRKLVRRGKFTDHPDDREKEPA